MLIFYSGQSSSCSTSFRSEYFKVQGKAYLHGSYLL